MHIHPILLFALAGIVLAQPDCFKNDESKNRLIVKDCSTPLILTKNQFSKIAKEDVTYLLLSNVTIDTIPKDAFDGFEMLSTIEVKDVNVNKIHPEAFSLPEIERLNIVRTHFGTIPKFSSEYMRELILKDCQLSEIPNLDNLKGLEYLNLANNVIRKIDDQSFRNVENLEELHMPNNRLSEITPNALTTTINKLDLDNNPLKKIDFNFPENLESLSLKNCQLNTFNGNIAKKMKSVLTLFLNDNNITILPIDAFEPMEDLDTLDLSGNKLSELDDNIFGDNQKLDRIVLDKNPLTKLPTFQTKSTIRSFSCRNCGLQTVQNAFNSINIAKLDLSQNFLKSISGVFNIQGLKHLILEDNFINTLQFESIDGKVDIQSLNLAGNSLSPLDPVAFDLMPFLKELNVSNCNLGQLWSNHNSNLPSLETLTISRNQLVNLTVDDLKVVPALKILDAQENPLACLKPEFEKYLETNDVYSLEFPNQENCTDHYSTNPDSTYDAEDDLMYEDDLTTGSDYVIDGNDEDVVEASVISTNSFNLGSASYVLAITSVFILTALFVLLVAVLITLLVLRKNKSFGQSNLPRFKIPLWQTSPGQKKHSGSVYKPLSEEFGSTISQYHFTQTPQVHTALP